MIKIEKSECGAFVRITLNSVVTVVTMSDWPNALSNNSRFKPFTKAKIPDLKPLA